jgi:hypothetical protein
MGLYWSRLGKLEQALEWLGPLYARHPNDDETAGITAGVHKRRWLADRSRSDDLQRSQRAYREAYKGSGKRSTYLGINTATTALFLGKRDEARRLAREVEELLRQRAAVLPGELNDLDFWDAVTLAEARLLQGDRAGAEALYRSVFTRYAGLREGDIAVARAQMEEILKALEALGEGDRAG